MKILSHIYQGKRASQKDAMAQTDSYNIICDGVGGDTRSELASRFIANYISEQYSKSHEEPSKSSIQALAHEAELALNHYALEYPYSIISTTFAALFIAKGQAFVAQAGDSRV